MLFVREDCAWLVELAKALAATMSQPSHEITVKPLSAAEFVERRKSGAFSLAVDAVRSFASGSLGALVALATADSASRASELMLHPPKLGEVSARTLTRTLHCGIVGEIRVHGGRASDVQLFATGAGAIDFGATYRSRPQA